MCRIWSELANIYKPLDFRCWVQVCWQIKTREDICCKSALAFLVGCYTQNMVVCNIAALSKKSAAVICLSALIPVQALCEGGHCCPGILAGHNLCSNRQMVPLAHLLQLLTKGGFCVRSWAPCLVYSLQWESGEWSKRGSDQGDGME